MTREQREAVRAEQERREVQAYADRLAAVAPPLSPEQMRVVLGALRPVASAAA